MRSTLAWREGGFVEENTYVDEGGKVLLRD